MRRLPALAGRMALLAILLAACAGPLDDDNSDDAPPTPPPAGPASTSTAGGEPATPGQSDLDQTSTETAPRSTASEASTTPDADGSPTPRASASPSPTIEPLPEDGEELQVEGQPVTQIIQGSEDGQTLYAVADGMLWRSSDGGRSWSEAGNGDVGSVIVALNEPELVYSGDRGTCGRGFSFYDFMRSTDAGSNWETIDANRDIEPYLAYAMEQGIYLYGSNCGLSVSPDGGDTWTQVTDLNGEEVFAVVTERDAPLAQLLVVGTTEGGTGRLFLLNNNNPAAPQFVRTVAQFWGSAAVDWTNGRIVLAAANAVGVSDDGGANWTWSRDGLEEATFSVDPLFEAIPDEELDPFRGFDFVRIDPIDRDRIWVGGVHGAFLSTDGGQTWERVGEDEMVTGLVVSTISDRILISTESGTRLWSLSG